MINSQTRVTPGEPASFEDAALFHGHVCPGLAFGYRVARRALEECRKGRAEDEELVAVVENDACGIDAIQVVTGCTVGKGNLILHDFGKSVYTFFLRPSGRGVRIAIQQFSTDTLDPGLPALSTKVRDGEATPDEEAEMLRRTRGVVDTLLRIPDDELLDVTQTTVTIPEPARLFTTATCASCGETVAESRARIRDGKIVCIPCAGSYGRGWGKE
ncbi:MAG: TraR/DksA C4-type zinc finger protein [Methanomicrobiaceae archaeon]|nr:TraR/DksA C4-type zinc finger protein [Methanomicrobiaceae archaeon]